MSRHTPTDYVEVLKADYTVTTYSRAMCDKFTTDTLTVTSLDDDTVLATYGPGTWRTGCAYGPDGYPAYACTSLLEDEEKRRARNADYRTGPAHGVR